jgi:hypothetical protein
MLVAASALFAGSLYRYATFTRKESDKVILEPLIPSSSQGVAVAYRRK